jgi:hypothetical protein
LSTVYPWAVIQRLASADRGPSRDGRRPLLAALCNVGPIACGVALILCVAAHVWSLGSIPQGLFIDESSIGFNAATLAESGTDQDGEHWPVLFRSFGDYKSPLYIYVVALVFKVAGVSILSLRLTSAVFFFLFEIGLLLLVRRLISLRWDVLVYAALSAGFLPWFFPLSRIGFEVVSQLAVVTWAMLALHWATTAPSSGRPLVRAAIAGGLVGLSLYTYVSARLLTPLLLLSVVAIWRERAYWARLAAFSLVAAVVVAPMAGYALIHPETIFARPEAVSYLADGLPPASLLARFTRTYLSYFGPAFLLFSGDPNLRHATGIGGEVYWSVLVLALIGVGAALLRRELRHDPCLALLTLLLVAAPIAAALTEPRHALRSLLVGVGLLLFSALGMAELGRLAPTWQIRAALGVLLICAVGGEAARYTVDYFGSYSERSLDAFDTYPLQPQVALAAAFGPGEIRISAATAFDRANAEFYRRVLKRSTAPPIRAVATASAEAGTCLIYHQRETSLLPDVLKQPAVLDRVSGKYRLLCW